MVVNTYSFAPYLTARYAADFQLMMYADGDTAMIENSDGHDHTLQQMLFKRFFASDSDHIDIGTKTKRAGHRVRLIEQYVKPGNDSVLQCTEDLATDKAKWNYAMENCEIAAGNIVARSDSIYALNVHHPETLPVAYLPRDDEDCSLVNSNAHESYFLGTNEFVEIHLRNRMRKEECTCFINSEHETKTGLR